MYCPNSQHQQQGKHDSPPVSEGHIRPCVAKQLQEALKSSEDLADHRLGMRVGWRQCPRPAQHFSPLVPNELDLPLQSEEGRLRIQPETTPQHAPSRGSNASQGTLPLVASAISPGGTSSVRAPPNGASYVRGELPLAPHVGEGNIERSGSPRDVGRSHRSSDFAAGNQQTRRYMGGDRGSQRLHQLQVLDRAGSEGRGEEREEGTRFHELVLVPATDPVTRR